MRTPGVRLRNSNLVARRLRAAQAGFTLVELMVVVVLISILAVIATPAMKVARDDRLAFDYARRIEQLIHRARVRAGARGASHLMVALPSGASRGKFLLFEALDGTLPAAGGPNPLGNCKAPTQWTDVAAFVPGAISNNARIVEGLDLNTAGVNVDADIRTAFIVDGTAVQAIAICVNPSGATYVGTGANAVTAISSMQLQTVPFGGYAEIDVTRNKGGLPVGLLRSILVTGAAAPRIRSR